MSPHDQPCDILEVVCFFNRGGDDLIATRIAEALSFFHNGHDRFLKFGHDVGGFTGGRADAGSPRHQESDGAHEVLFRDVIHPLYGFNNVGRVDVHDELPDCVSFRQAKEDTRVHE